MHSKAGEDMKTHVSIAALIQEVFKDFPEGATQYEIYEALSKRRNVDYRSFTGIFRKEVKDRNIRIIATNICSCSGRTYKIFKRVK